MQSNLTKARIGALGPRWVTKWREKPPATDPASAPAPAPSTSRAGRAKAKNPAKKTETA
jgi:hypothetical protein